MIQLTVTFFIMVEVNNFMPTDAGQPALKLHVIFKIVAGQEDINKLSVFASS